MTERLFEYAEYFYEAAHKITDFILNMNHSDIGKLDTYFFSISFLYRHCMELGLKAIGFQFIQNEDERKRFVKDTCHDLFSILSVIENKIPIARSREEVDWLKKYFYDLSQKDRESDSFRYPFQLVWEDENWEYEGKFVIKKIFNEQTHIDLVKFANKFEAAYEIISLWYKKESEEAVEWRKLEPIFIETGGYYYGQSVVGYKYRRDDFLY